jgi:hypothetical protein
MAEDKTNRGSADATRINIREDYEVRYWSQKFGVTTEQLVAAVNAVGVMANDVELSLKPK